MVPAMRDFVNRFALSTYDLKLSVNQQIVSLGIKKPDGQVVVLDFTLDQEEADNHVAFLNNGTLQFHIENLQEFLEIEVEVGRQLSDEDLEDYRIVVFTTQK